MSAPNRVYSCIDGLKPLLNSGNGVSGKDDIFAPPSLCVNIFLCSWQLLPSKRADSRIASRSIERPRMCGYTAHKDKQHGLDEIMLIVLALQVSGLVSHAMLLYSFKLLQTCLRRARTRVLIFRVTTLNS
jgi:hypothetical protein